MQIVVSPNTVPGQLDKELNSSKSRIGLRKVMCYLKYKIGLTHVCFSSPVFFFHFGGGVLAHLCPADELLVYWRLCRSVSGSHGSTHDPFSSDNIVQLNTVLFQFVQRRSVQVPILFIFSRT
jgi:hypothetical protein